MGLLEIVMNLNAYYYLALWNIMLLMIGLDILQDQKTALHRFFSHNPAKIKIYSYDDLLLKETITLHYVVTF